jgi:hypothetical protein
MALCVLAIIFDIIKLVERNNQENWCLMHVWLFTHGCYTLLALVGLYSSLPVCTRNEVHVWQSIFLSALNALATCYFLVEVKSYSRQLKARPNRDTQEVSQNTTSSEVPPVFLIHLYT